MEWELIWGAQSHKLPLTAKAWDKKPKLSNSLLLYIEAYAELKTERQVGMAIGCIPWSAIIRWAEFNEINDKDKIHKLVRFIRAMENKERQHRDKDK